MNTQAAWRRRAIEAEEIARVRYLLMILAPYAHSRWVQTANEHREARRRIEAERERQWRALTGVPVQRTPPHVERIIAIRARANARRPT